MSPRKICTAVTHGSKKSIITLANVFLFDLFRSNQFLHSFTSIGICGVILFYPVNTNENKNP